MNLIQVFPVVLPNEAIVLIPIDSNAIDRHEILRSDSRYTFLTLDLAVPKESFKGLEGDYEAFPLTTEKIDLVVSSRMKCFVEVDYARRLKIRSSGHGDKLIILHVEQSKKMFGLTRESSVGRYDTGC